MAIDEVDKIDLLMTDEKKTSVYLIIFDHLDWKTDEGEHLLLLQNKINAYLNFVESGQLVRSRPNLKNLPVTIRVDAKYSLSSEAAKFYRLVGPVAAKVAVSLELEIGRSGETIRF